MSEDISGGINGLFSLRATGESVSRLAVLLRLINSDFCGWTVSDGGKSLFLHWATNSDSTTYNKFLSDRESPEAIAEMVQNWFKNNKDNIYPENKPDTDGSVHSGYLVTTEGHFPHFSISCEIKPEWIVYSK